uniref:HD domain-containing protein n=1 Tax=Desertifilum tharense IPPAS B-1220 TaxID=1781255 RepID=A0ACD5GNB5_9CYAN
MVLTATYECTVPDWLQDCLATSSIVEKTEVERQERDSPREAPRDGDLIRQAFEFAYQLHRGQYRKSGEPYISHPVAVAGLLRELGGSAPMIAAGFLHDVVEDTDVTPEEIEQRFGTEVRHLVEGVTKLSKFTFSSKTERQAENFRRMFLAMAKDIRVIVVKLVRSPPQYADARIYESGEAKSDRSRDARNFCPFGEPLGNWSV